MRIKKVELKNFKRFTDLTISDLPQTSKLILLIGSNGSGKSSLFDAFDWLSKGGYKNYPYLQSANSEDYYLKNILSMPSVCLTLSDDKKIEKNGEHLKTGAELVKRFFGRSSNRIIPRIIDNANINDISTDRDSPVTYIENDTRFINDATLFMQQVNSAIREPLFSGKQPDILTIFKNFIEPLNSSLLNIFGSDAATTIQIAEFKDATPNTKANLIFKKGDSKISYDLLSHGEKQVIILLINFMVRKEYYHDSIIFIDEMDCHLNTALQSTLLNEIVTRWIPDDAQLWTASHALGFIDYARNSDISSIIDFDLLDFDTKKEIIPITKDRLEVYEIAIPKATIASILNGYKLVVVENKNDQYFNAALGEEGYLFLPANNNTQVYLTVKSGEIKTGLRDRDYLREDEIRKIQIQLPALKILLLYTFENYIYHPENIAEMAFSGFDKDEYVAEITRQKNAILIDIVSEIGTSRSHYVEFKDFKNDGNIKPITDALQSDEFRIFYPYFNMKKHFNKKYLNRFKYTFTDLAKTQWFKKELLATLIG